MKNLILFTIIFLVTSCNNDKNEPNGFNLDANVNINLRSNEGLDLLNTTKYNSNNFKVYYKINNEFIEQNHSHLDYPRQFIIDTQRNPITMILFLNSSSIETYPITVIKWNETESDTLKTSFRRGSGNDGQFVICEKIWLNNILVWEINNKNERQISIVK
jgi:hypothetical protein